MSHFHFNLLSLFYIRGSAADFCTCPCPKIPIFFTHSILLNLREMHLQHRITTKKESAEFLHPQALLQLIPPQPLQFHLMLLPPKPDPVSDNAWKSLLHLLSGAHIILWGTNPQILLPAILCSTLQLPNQKASSLFLLSAKKNNGLHSM